MTTAVSPWTPSAIDVRPPLPSTIVASASGGRLRPDYRAARIELLIAGIVPPQ